jgi:P-type E1-E2 ATPase
MMICERTISQSFYQTWAYKFDQAKKAINHKQLKITNVVSELERDFQLLGATGVDDILQDRVEESIQSLVQADIKMWMLTGDRIETAVNVGFGCRLLDSGT